MPADIKVLGTTDIQSCQPKFFFQWSLARTKSRSVNVARSPIEFDIPVLEYLTKNLHSKNLADIESTESFTSDEKPAESRILAAPVDTRPWTSFISFCTVQLRTLYAARSLATLSLYDLWSRPWRVARLLGLNGLPPWPHPSEGVG